LLGFESEPEIAGVTPSELQLSAFPNYLKAARCGYVPGSCSIVLLRDRFLHAGGFHTMRMNAEDHDLMLRMGLDTGFVQILAPVTLGYRSHGGNATGCGRANFAGVRYLVEQERLGAYPGGPRQARSRRAIITTHIRPVAVACLRQKMFREAFELYRTSFAWHAALGRWKFLAGLPALAAVRSIQEMRL
jgi:hypothetical protein